MDADSKAFDRIVSNLVVNAVRYAQAHGDELVYQRTHPHGARFELVLPRPHVDEPNELGPS